MAESSIDLAVLESPEFRRLEVKLPMLIESLGGWVTNFTDRGIKKSNQTQIAHDKVAEAFRKAQDLGVMGLKTFQDLYDRYQKLVPDVEKITKETY